MLPKQKGELSGHGPGLIVVGPALILVVFGENAEDIRIAGCIYQQNLASGGVHAAILAENFDGGWYL